MQSREQVFASRSRRLLHIEGTRSFHYQAPRVELLADQVGIEQLLFDQHGLCVQGEHLYRVILSV